MIFSVHEKHERLLTGMTTYEVIENHSRFPQRTPIVQKTLNFSER
jgi:hypothetical protein